MPICVHCSTPIDALYVSYGPTHIICTRCKACQQFADPYVENETIIVAIDLILVKPSAYRHLLFNKTTGKRTKPYGILVRHFLALLLVDAYLRWFYLCRRSTDADADDDDGTKSRNEAAFLQYLAIVRSTACIQLTLHAVVMLLSIVYSQALSFNGHVYDDVDALSLFHLVPQSLLLSSLTPTFLLCLLLLWQQPLSGAHKHDGWQWDEANIDWAIRTLVNGLSAGVALGVVLPLQRTKMGALAATAILLAGWLAQWKASQLVDIPFHSGVGVLNTEAGHVGSARYCKSD